jgi:phosphohistidine phosphatase SixA
MIVFALRHADREPEPNDALSDKGRQRALVLARLLGESGIRNAWCSNAERARQTLKPLQDAAGANLTVAVVPIDEQHSAEQHQQTIIAAVKQLPANATAAIISHSNTIGPIVKGLTGQSIGNITQDQFDKLFVLSIPPTGAASVTLLRYGEKT